MKGSEKGNLRIGDWSVWAGEDEDGHLTIELQHADGTQIFDMGEDLIDQTSYTSRYTTERIEEAELILSDVADEFEDDPPESEQKGSREGCPHHHQCPAYCIFYDDTENEKRKAEPYDEVKDTLFQKEYRHKNL